MTGERTAKEPKGKEKQKTPAQPQQMQPEGETFDPQWNSPTNILMLQRTLGNRAVQRLVEHPSPHSDSDQTQPSRSIQRTPRADMGERTNGRAYGLEWDEQHRQIDQDSTLRAAFEQNLTAQIQRFFGEALTQEQVMTRISQADTAGNAEEAAELRRKLSHANQFAVVETLRVENSERYLAVGERGSGNRRTYCNIYAYDVVSALGGYLPRVWWRDAALRRIRAGEQVPVVYDRTVHELNANALADWMVEFGGEFGWQRAADMSAGQTAANNGQLVILLAARDNPRLAGHVSVVMPEIRAEDNVRDASGNQEIHEATRNRQGEVTRPMQSQAGGSNFEYRAANNFTAGESYRDGGAFIFSGRPQSPLLTPEQLGYSENGRQPTVPGEQPPTDQPVQPPAEQPAEQPGQTPSRSTEPQTPPAANQDSETRAVRLNERYGARLGWNNHVDQIVTHLQSLGLLPPDMSPAPPLFADAIRQYQARQQGLSVDGILGPNTWRVLRSAIGIEPQSPNAPNSGSSTSNAPNSGSSNSTVPNPASSNPAAPNRPNPAAPNAAPPSSSNPAAPDPEVPTPVAPEPPSSEPPAPDVPNPDASMAATNPLPLRGLTGIDRQMAQIHNQYGNYLTQKSTELGITVADAAAFLKVESGGRGFDSSGRMIIRFENHKFFDLWGRENRAQYDQHFTFNNDRRWTGHQFRTSATGEMQSVHGGQDSEWAAFEFARSLNAEAAMQSISMGNAQILGSNYRLVGYRSVQEMFDDMSGSLESQTEGLFTYIQRRRDGIIVTALQSGDYRLAARYYNGVGKEELYGERIRAASEAYRRVTTETASSPAIP